MTLHHVAVQPLQSLVLQLAGNDVIGFYARRIVDIFAKEILLDVIDIALILATSSTIHLVQVVVLTVGLGRPLLQVLYDTRRQITLLISQLRKPLIQFSKLFPKFSRFTGIPQKQLIELL